MSRRRRRWCRMKKSPDTDDISDEIKIVPDKTEARLTQKQYVDYRSYRESLTKWLLHFGKNPEKAEGYSSETLKVRLYRMDKFMRWVWDEEDGYTTDVTTEHADEFVKELAYSEESEVSCSNYVKALKMLFKWKRHERHGEDWDPKISFRSDTGAHNPREYFTREERKKLREASLEYDSIPRYRSLSQDERDEWLTYLSQRLGKPKADLTREDWKKANSWKVPSLVAVSLDTGLRPVEVKRAVTSWVDVQNGVLRIPKEDSSKNVDNWVVGLRSKTSEVLERWLEERKEREMYNDTEKLWLTSYGNPYESPSLIRLLEKLCEIANIDTEDRKISWYNIRHSTGTYMVREEDLASAQAQLRHKSEETTMKYDQAPVEDRKSALERMG
jgi:site-specific recombinase XerD